MNQATLDLILAAVNFDLVAIGIGSIAAAVALVFIAQRGAKMLLGMIRG